MSLIQTIYKYYNNLILIKITIFINTIYVAICKQIQICIIIRYIDGL